MQAYERFIFRSHVYDPQTGRITLTYSLDDIIEFTEIVTLPHPLPIPPGHKEELDRALFALHLAGGASYYKTCCPREIVVESGKLSGAEAAFWDEVYENGLGEFFYKNQIDFRGLIKFPRSDDAPLPSPLPVGEGKAEKILLPIGGGKDSLVAMELLRKSGAELTLLRVGGHPLIEELAKIAGLELLTVKRQLSPALFALNAEGALNGHVPITAYLSCLAMVIAILGDFDGVALSNERSAEEGNVEYLGKEINHQWSKSLTFERGLQKYLRETVATPIAYFSALRPWSELRIVQEFVKFPQYFSGFTSCNANWKILSTDRSGDPWCCRCPKCAFAFALLAAFLPIKKLEGIFGKNLFEDKNLLPLYCELLGLQGSKPFECVGTPEEVQAAFLLARERGEYNDTLVMNMFLQESMPSIRDPKALITDALAPSTDHAIPNAFDKLLSQLS